MAQVKKVWYAPHQFQAYGEEEIKAVEAALRTGQLAGGQYTIQFEKRVAEHFKKKFGLFVNSGSSANMLAIVCAGVGKGVEVVTPACTFNTTVAPLLQLGATVKFCDVEELTFNAKVEDILAEVTKDTKVIVVPNLLGNRIDWGRLKAELTKIGRTDIILVEDSCDTMNATPFSDIATVSFYASHVITSGGTGGMVMFNDEALHHRATQIRDWGRVGGNSEAFAERFNHGLIDGIQYDWKFIYSELGFNFKSSEMNAAFGLVQMDKLEKNRALRNRLFARYLSTLRADAFASKYYKFPVVHWDDVLWLALPLQCADRGQLLEYLESNEIQTRVAMAGNILRHPLYKSLLPEQAARAFPISDQVMREAFLVGCHHGLDEADVDRVCAVLSSFARSKLQGG